MTEHVKVCPMGTKITPERCKINRTKYTSCQSCAGLKGATEERGECASCVTLWEKVDRGLRREAELRGERDQALDLAKNVRIQRDKLQGEITKLKEQLARASMPSVSPATADSPDHVHIIEFRGDNVATIGKLLKSCRKTKTDPADEICSLIDAIENGTFTLERAGKDPWGPYTAGKEVAPCT